MKHPLINPDSKHYHQPGVKAAIQLMEEKYTPLEMLTWAIITREKYLLRLGFKEGTNDSRKIETFTAYITFIENVILPSITAKIARAENLAKCYELIGLEIDYDIGS